MKAMILVLLAAVSGSAAASAMQRAPPEPPRTINGIVLGNADEFAVTGPARICLIHTSVDLQPGETAWLDYSGIHFGSVRISGPRGTFLVEEGGMWREPEGSALVPDFRSRAVARYQGDGQRHYMIYRASENDPNNDYPSVRVSGDALGRSHDLNILARIDVDQHDAASCRRRFNWGWGVIFGEEPLEIPR